MVNVGIIITKTIKKLMKKNNLLNLHIRGAIADSLGVNRTGVTHYLICKIGFSFLCRVPVRFYFFFKFYFFRGNLVRGVKAPGTPVSNLPLRQSLNDYFFSPAIFSKLNKNSR